MAKMFGSLGGQINGVQIWESLKMDSQTVKSTAFGTATIRARGEAEADYLTFFDETGRAVPQTESGSQFVPLYLGSDGKLVLPFSNKIQANLKGSDDQPDVKMKIRLEAFHLGNTDEKTKATLRLQVSQDGEFTRGSDTLYWVVAAGLDLWKQVQGGEKKAAAPSELKTDFAKAFQGRDISIPGGAGYLRIEIIQHKEKNALAKLWDVIVNLFQRPEGIALASVIGFPAITLPALKFFDELINRVKDDSSHVLIASRDMRCAFNDRAVKELTFSNPGVTYPVMNEGIYVLVKAGHLNSVMDKSPTYVGGFGLLKPSDVTDDADFLDDYALGNYVFKEVPYAVISVRSKQADLDEKW